MREYSDTRGSIYSIQPSNFNVEEILINEIRQNVWKGFHLSPYRKRIFVLSGKLIDYMFHPTTSEYKEILLNTGDSIEIPANFAHGLHTINDCKIVYCLEGKFDVVVDKNIHWTDPLFPLRLNLSQAIMSDKDQNAQYFKQYDYVVLGSQGFLGINCLKILKKQGYSVLEVNDRFDHMSKIIEKIKKSQAKYVICAAGISGKPTIEWSETHEEETYQTNFLGVLDLMRETRKLGIHLTIFGSGAVYSSKQTAYSETDDPDFNDKVYSKWRIQLEKHIKMFNNVLYLRIMYPITLDSHPKCFLTKMIARKDSVHNINVSTTVVPNMFPFISTMCYKKLTGIYNFVNKGTISLPNLIRLILPDSDIISTQDNESRGGYELLINKLEVDLNKIVDDPYSALIKLKMDFVFPTLQK